MISQVFTDGKLRNKNAQSIATKVLLQIIAKRGNTLWAPRINSKVSDVMLIGVDNAAIKNSNVIAACGTVNSTFTSIYTKTVKYNNITQKFSAINTAVLNIIDYYADRNKSAPKDIIIFTNSCSRDQVKNLIEFFIE